MHILTPWEQDIIRVIISQRYSHDEDNEILDFMSETFNASKQDIKTLKDKHIIKGNGENLGVIYKYYIQVWKDIPLSDCFLDYKKPTPTEISLFELTSGITFDPSKIGRPIYNMEEV